MRWQEIKNNPLARQRLRDRARILRMTREFFWRQGFLEMDSPLLVSQPALEVHLNHLSTVIIDEKGKKHPAYLITSPEYSLKKILAGQPAKIFQLGKVFRDGEPWNENHHPEFTLLEWYRPCADYKKIMTDIEKLVLFLVKKKQLQYQGREIDLTPPWPRLSMRQAWQKYAGVELNHYLTREKMSRLAKKKDYTVLAKESFDDLFFKIFLSEIEPKIAALNQPVFLYDYPRQMAALARLKKNDSRYAERFELYIGGLELANAYSELVDWRVQESRFKQDQRKRGQLGKEVYNIDKDLVAALKSGLPSCAGAALGIDRLIMLLTNSCDIKDVIL